jgi:hypothetical protein
MITVHHDTTVGGRAGLPSDSTALLQIQTSTRAVTVTFQVGPAAGDPPLAAARLASESCQWLSNHESCPCAARPPG